MSLLPGSGAMPDFFNILNFALKDFLSVASDNFKNKKVHIIMFKPMVFGPGCPVLYILHTLYMILTTEYHV